MAETLASALLPIANLPDGSKVPKSEEQSQPSTNAAGAVVIPSSSSISSPPEPEEAEVAYDDFGKRTATRDFELIVEGRPLFVNAHWLAELSPYFYDFFFGEYNEHQRKTAILDDESYDSILELLRCVVDCPVRKPIEESNVNDLLDMSSVYSLKSLHAACAKYVNQNLGDMSDALVLELLQTAAKRKTDVALLNRLVKHVSNSLPLEQLESLRGKIDANVLVDMYIVKTRALCGELEMERARNAINENKMASMPLLTPMTPVSPMPTPSGPTKKRKLESDAVDLNVAFACVRCKRDRRAPSNAVTMLCAQCGSYRCTPACTRSTCKGH